MVQWFSLLLAFIIFQDEREHRMWQRRNKEEGL